MELAVRLDKRRAMGYIHAIIFQMNLLLFVGQDLGAQVFFSRSAKPTGLVVAPAPRGIELAIFGTGIFPHGVHVVIPTDRAKFSIFLGLPDINQLPGRSACDLPP